MPAATASTSISHGVIRMEKRETWKQRTGEGQEASRHSQRREEAWPHFRRSESELDMLNLRNPPFGEREVSGFHLEKFFRGRCSVLIMKGGCD